MFKKQFRVLITWLFCAFSSILLIDYLGLCKHIFELDYNDFFYYPLHGNVMHYAHQYRYEKEVDIAPINYYNFDYDNITAKCKTSVIPSDIRLTVLIKSSSNNFDRRAVIRKTWGKGYGYPYFVQSIFLLGSSNNKDLEMAVGKEAELFKDIVKSNYVDSYYNNTIKTLMGIRWVVHHCTNSSYYMFVDDDYYVSLPNVFQFLANRSLYLNFTWEDVSLQKIIDASTKMDKNHKYELKTLRNQKNTFYAGFAIQSTPHRHKFSRWYIDLKEYPYDLWPPYVTAGAYILSLETLLDIYYTSLYTKHLKFDDIYLGILAVKAKIPITHSTKFYFQKPKYDKSFCRTVIASHGYDNHKELLKTWTDCHSKGYA